MLRRPPGVVLPFARAVQGCPGLSSPSLYGGAGLNYLCPEPGQQDVAIVGTGKNCRAPARHCRDDDGGRRCTLSRRPDAQRCAPRRACRAIALRGGGEKRKLKTEEHSLPVIGKCQNAVARHRARDKGPAALRRGGRKEKDNSKHKAKIGRLKRQE